MKIALIEAAHWHVPLYLPALSSPEIELVAIADSQGTAGPCLAKQFGARCYESHTELLRRESIDFAFAFGRPSQMPRIGEDLLAAGIPFALEKPCGTSLAAVKQLQASAARTGAFVAVPYIYRVGMLRDAFHEVEGQLPNDFKHLSFRFIGGSPQRYIASKCEWMLDPQYSGGGSTMNLAGHFVDLFSILSAQQITAVSAVMSHATHGLDIEDYSVMTLHGANGALAVIETGYTFPGNASAPREFTFSARSAAHYYSSTPSGMSVRSISAPDAKPCEVAIELNNDRYYALFAGDTLERVRRGAAPVCGLGEAVAVMQVMDAAYRSAGENGRPVAIER